MLPVLCIAAVTQPYGRVRVGASGLEEQVVPSRPYSTAGSVDGWVRTAKKEMREEICGECR